MTLRFIVFYALSSLVAGVQIQNIAQGKSATQSSQTNANKAVDGRKYTSFDQNSCTLTNVENNSWWKVDLGEQTKIRAVIITSSNKPEHSLSGIEIWIDTSLDPNTTTSTRCGMIPSFDPERSLYLSCNGVKGQFVTVSLPENNRVLSLCEVQVFPTDFVYPQPNVAVKGEAVQSSTLFPARANRAIDRKRHTFYTEGSCSHTRNETDPWWRVDLHQVFIISQVKITNRGDCCPERLDGAEIRIGNSLDNNGNNNPGCANITHIPGGNTFTFTCESGSMEGRYVNVVIPGNHNILTLCEVEVYGNPAVEPLKQVAFKRPAAQCSTNSYHHHSHHEYWASAEKAVKSCQKHTLSSQCCVETDWNHDAWWRVDLGLDHRVTAVAIHTRDCCSEYIIGAKIKIGNNDDHHHNPKCGEISSSDLIQTFYCFEMVGRYVSVNIRENTLSFCRLEVYGSPVVPEEPDEPTTAPPAVVFASSSAQIGDRTVFLMDGRLCWSDALLYCRRNHGDLLDVHGPEEQAQVEELLKNSSFVLSDNMWLGLRREVLGLRWFWMSGQAVTFDRWRPYPPLFPSPCGAMEGEGGLWRPLSCGELNNFLCQTDPAQPPNQVSFYSSKVKT